VRTRVPSRSLDEGNSILEGVKMTIYMVEHAFCRPDWEDEWNAWYQGNLKVLMSVPGFRTAQRFKELGAATPPHYMAVYTVDSPEVFESKRYIEAGGGGTNSQRFRPAYQVWIRNLFEGIDVVPAVRDGECLVSVDCTMKEIAVPGVALTWLGSTGFHKTTPFRGIGVARLDQAEALQKLAGVRLYRPITAQQGPLY
jgi:hypothetical protein